MIMMVMTHFASGGAVCSVVRIVGMRVSREFFWLLVVGFVSVGMGLAWYIDRSKLELRLERSIEIQQGTTREHLKAVKENNDLRQKLDQFKK